MKTVDKKWGHELWIHNDTDYCGKRLFFTAGKKCSLHYHVLKSETFYVESGSLECVFVPLSDMTSDGLPEHATRVTLGPGDSVEVPPLTVHQMRAVDGDAVLFEFSTQHFDSDSIRLERGD